MNFIHKLVGETAIYGLSSIIGRLLNFLLVPLYTSIFSPEEYGVLSILMTLVAFAMVTLTYGFETSFFHFSKKELKNQLVFSTGFISLITTGLFFVFICLYFTSFINELIGLEKNSCFVKLLSIIILFDVISTLPFAKLRFEKKAIKFAWIRLINIFINIGLNLFFFLGLPHMAQKGLDKNILSHLYIVDFGLGYIFLANLIASFVMVLLLIPDIYAIPLRFNFKLWKKMFHYSFPLLIVGLAFVTNEMVDKLLLEYMLPSSISNKEVGIYSACYKISIFMTLFIQAFRYGAEPFFFSESKHLNAKKNYALVMQYFIAFAGLIFLAINVFIDFVKHFIADSYHEGLTVVPILLAANLFLGIYYNLSVWYKVTDNTIYGAYISLFGVIITLIVNIFLIPSMSYLGSALATLLCYLFMCVLSLYFGSKHYRILYNWRNISFYLLFALGLTIIWYFIHDDHFIISGLFCLIYIVSIYLVEKKKINTLIT